MAYLRFLLLEAALTRRALAEHELRALARLPYWLPRLPYWLRHAPKLGALG